MKTKTRKIRIISRITPLGLVSHEYYSKDQGQIIFRENESVQGYLGIDAVSSYHVTQLQLRLESTGKTGSMTHKETVEMIVS